MAPGTYERGPSGVRFDLGRQSHFMWVTADGTLAYDTRRAG